MLTRRTLMTATAASAAFALPTWHAMAKTPKGVFVMAKQIDDIVSFDPAESYEFTNNEVNAQCYNRLVLPDKKDSNKLVGDLAESWTVSKDGKDFTFHLKKTLKFASGNTVTAHDAAYSLQRAVILNKTPGFIITQFGFNKDNVAKLITAADDFTLKMTLPTVQATSFVLYCLSATIGSVVEKAVVSAHDVGGDMGNAWMKTRTVGSGPYQLTEWAASDHVICDVNPHSAIKPQNRRVAIRHVADPSAQLLSLEKGDADVARDLTSELLKKAKTEKGFHVSASDQGSVNYVAMNMANDKFKKIGVHQAIKWAIDYDGIANNIVPEIYQVCQSFLSSGLPGALTTKPFKRDVAKAKKLLADAGFPNGFECTMDHYNTAPFPDIAQAIQANLKDIGIKVTLLPGEKKQVITKTRARTHELALLGWGTDYFDPNSNAQAFCANPDDSDNSKLKILAWRSHFVDAEMTKLCEEAAKELDAKKRIDMYHQLQKLAWERAPFAFILQPVSTAVLAKGVSGFVMGPVDADTVYANVKKA